ncbi:MAG: discoidin domain-containing protein, partial [Planctomycetota bacterium]
MSKKFMYLAPSVLVLCLAAGVASAQEVSINFQSQGAPIPEGYLPDYGEVFGDRGNGFSYGWDVDATGATRDRNNAGAPDQRYDTVNHLQPNRTDPERTWEIALANGSYNLFIVCGDPSYADSINTLDVEGTVLTDPDGEDNFDEYTVAVVVSDGRLTIKQAPDSRTTYAKLCFVDITLGIPLGAARSPDPVTGATDVPRDVTLSWTPGAYAPAINGHRVYLSDNFSDVNDGIGGVTQDASSYDPGRLELGTTYYWRVDEVNAPPDSTVYKVYKGSVWSFTTEPVGYPISGANITATASSAGGADFGPEKTIDGSGLDPNDLHSTEPVDMWLSDSEPLGAWVQYELDKVYKLHEMWVWNSNQIFEGLFGFGMKDVTVEYSTNGTDWTALAGVPEFAQAPGTNDYAHNITVDFGGAAAQYVRLTATSNWGGVLPQYGLSEVRLFHIPVSAREPSPD